MDAGICVTRERCILIWRIITDLQNCRSTDSWLNSDSRNFVDINMEAQMHTETVDEKTDANEICLTKDGQKIEGA